MIHLHATKKLLATLPVDENGLLPQQANTRWLHEQVSATHNPLSGWHGNLLIIQRRKCLLLVHDKTRFPLFIPSLTKPNFANLDWWFTDSLMNTLLKCGASDALMNAAHNSLQPLCVDAVCDRSVQGTMNQMKGDVEHGLWMEEVDVAHMTGHRTGAWLADRPCTIKGQKECVWPAKAMFALLEEMTPQVQNDQTLPDNVVALKDYLDD